MDDGTLNGEVAKIGKSAVAVENSASIHQTFVDNLFSLKDLLPRQSNCGKSAVVFITGLVVKGIALG